MKNVFCPPRNVFVLKWLSRTVKDEARRYKRPSGYVYRRQEKNGRRSSTSEGWREWWRRWRWQGEAGLNWGRQNGWERRESRDKKEDDAEEWEEEEGERGEEKERRKEVRQKKPWGSYLITEDEKKKVNVETRMTKTKCEGDRKEAAGH